MQEPQAAEPVAEISGRTAPVRRSPLRAAGSIVLWVLAAIAFLFAAISAAVSVATGAFAGAAAFYLFVGLGLVFFGVALWRRRDPRPTHLNGRTLTAAGAVSLVAAFVSSSVIGFGDPKPIFFAGQTYDVGRGLASVKAPGTDGWQSERQANSLGETVIFSRDVGRGETPEDAETVRAEIAVIAAKGNALPSDELIAQAVDTEKRINTGGRMRDLEFRRKPAPEYGSCVRYDWIGKDVGVEKFPGSVFILTMHGLMCTDRSATHLVQVAWSHRYLQGTPPKVEEASAEPFLASFKLSNSSSDVVALPSPRTGGVLFTDAFRDESGRWETGESENGRVGYLTGGGLGLEIKKPARLHAATMEVPAARDVQIEVDYRVTSTAAAFYGPTCRVDETFETFYMFVVTTDGQYGIRRWVAGEITDLGTSSGTFRATLQAPASIRIVAQCYGEGPVTLVLSANRTTLVRVQDNDGAITTAGRSTFFASGDPGPRTLLETFTVREIGR